MPIQQTSSASSISIGGSGSGGFADSNPESRIRWIRLPARAVASSSLDSNHVLSIDSSRRDHGVEGVSHQSTPNRLASSRNVEVLLISNR